DAPPLAAAPPTSVATTSENGGTPRAARNIAPIAVRSSRDMIAGLVNATMSDTSSRDGSVGRHATAVSATVRHHTSDASAGWAPRDHGEKPESGLAAPTATWAANATAVRTANVP